MLQVESATGSSGGVEPATGSPGGVESAAGSSGEVSWGQAVAKSSSESVGARAVKAKAWPDRLLQPRDILPTVRWIDRRIFADKAGRRGDREHTTWTPDRPNIFGRPKKFAENWFNQKNLKTNYLKIVHGNDSLHCCLIVLFVS